MALNRILQPVRDHFEQNAEAAALLKKVKVRTNNIALIFKELAGYRLSTWIRQASMISHACHVCIATFRGDTVHAWCTVLACSCKIALRRGMYADMQPC